MGIFRGLGKAEVSGTGQWFKEGNYLVKITGVKLVTGKRDNKDNFIIETEVLASDNDEIKVGAKRSQVIKMDGVMAFPNIKKFLAAVVGVDATVNDANEKIETAFAELVGRKLSIEDIAEYVVSDENPLSDIELELECVNILTREKKQPFTQHNWKSVSA